VLLPSKCKRFYSLSSSFLSQSSRLISLSAPEASALESSALESFAYFPKLPIEMRLKIWNAASFLPRLIGFHKTILKYSTDHSGRDYENNDNMRIALPSANHQRSS